MCKLRIGHGYDVHKLVEGRRLIIGGVEIEHKLGLLGHSDADVLLHAIMDALIGAMGLGDIGRHFPDTDEKYKGISSLSLLSSVYSLLKEEGYTVVNIDSTVIAQKPKLLPYIEKMKSNIAFVLNIDVDAVNVKATTEEHLGFTGREEGISAHAVALIEKK
jgi:2-C-methyl-D-erythritol 2,4-cyclodiphosphate synthase